MTIHKVNQPVEFTGPVTMPGGGQTDRNGNQTVPGDKTVNGNTTHKGKVKNEDTVELCTHTVATLPAAATNEGGIIYVSDGAAGNEIIAFSDGTNWLRVDTRAVVAAS